jgi:outer membrane protein OmpA-like peptidoglycan-associated protein
MRLLLIVFILPFFAASQNLLVNEGFEEENICSEYRVNCAPEGWIYTVPSFTYYFKDKSNAYEGTHYVALIAGYSNKPFYRTFVRSRLLCGLQKGKSYRFQCYVKSRHTILDSVGIYFSSYDFLFEKQVYQKIIPSVYFKNSLQKIVLDTNWQRVIINYTANGTEAFITLGNFSKRGIAGFTGIERENNFFVLFDNVSLTPTDRNEILCKDWQERKEGIYMQDERHEFLAKVIQLNRSKQPVAIKPTITKTLHIDTLTVPDVLFASNSFVLNRQAIKLLDSFTKKINNYKVDSIIVNGHTDGTGNDDFNTGLSWRRANSVAAFLQQSSKMNVISRGLGSEYPVADNRTKNGKQRNRRVEIFIYIRD